MERRTQVAILAAIFVACSFFTPGFSQRDDENDYLDIPTDPSPNPNAPWSVPPALECLLPEGWQTPCCHSVDPSSDWEMGYCFNDTFVSVCLNPPLGVCGNNEVARTLNPIEREYSLQLLRGIRAARIGLRPIVLVTNLSTFARAHSCYLYAERGQVDDWRDNRAKFILKYGIPYHLYAGLDDIPFPVIDSIEELDYYPGSPSDAIESWLSNENTRAIIRGNYNSIGIGVYAPTTFPAAFTVFFVNVVSGLTPGFPGTPS